MHAAQPIVARLDALHDQWVRFATDGDARLLLWLASAEEARLIEAFVARETDDALAETPDLFVELRAPFRDGHGHGRALLHELHAQYLEATDSEDPAEPRWSPAKEPPKADDVARVLAELESFRAFHVGGDSPALLAVLLAPAEAPSLIDYQLWLQRLVRDAPAMLRFIVVEQATAEAPPLASAEPKRVRAVRCALEMPAAVEQLARAGGELTPGDRLRTLIASLATAIEAGDLARVGALATAAKHVVETQGWPQHGAAVSLMVAAAQAGKERHDDALASYAEAERFALAQEALDAGVASEGEPATLGKKLRLQARLGAASVLFARGAHKSAAEAYLAAVPLAGSVGDVALQLDSERLASFCYAQANAVRQAWETGMAGLQRGLAMAPDTRKATTLLQLIEQLVAITGKHTQYRGERTPLEQRLARDLGRDWRAQLQPTPAG